MRLGIRKILFRALSLTLALCCVGAAAEGIPYFGGAEDMGSYQEMLQKGIMSAGNNLRLKKLIEKARSGAEVTVAAIGGSITEGAGASTYKECYAYRFMQGFRERFGAGDGTNVHFVNAGVGGTPSTFGLMRFDRDVTAR